MIALPFLAVAAWAAVYAVVESDLLALAVALASLAVGIGLEGLQ